MRSLPGRTVATGLPDCGVGRLHPAASGSLAYSLSVPLAAEQSKGRPEPGTPPHGLVEEDGVLARERSGNWTFSSQTRRRYTRGSPVHLAREEATLQVGPAAPEAPGLQIEHEAAARGGDVGFA